MSYLRKSFEKETGQQCSEFQNVRDEYEIHVWTDEYVWWLESIANKFRPPDTCPYCGSEDVREYTLGNMVGYARCKDCREDFDCDDVK